MTVIEVTKQEQLDNILGSNTNVVVDFAAEDWCVPCQRLAPHYKAVAEKMDNVTFVHIDIDRSEPSMMNAYRVAGVPTVLAFHNGSVVEKIGPAFHSAPRLTSKLTELYS